MTEVFAAEGQIPRISIQETYLFYPAARAQSMWGCGYGCCHGFVPYPQTSPSSEGRGDFPL